MTRILLSSLLVLGLCFSIIGCEDRRTTTYDEDTGTEQPPAQRQTEEPMYDTPSPREDTGATDQNRGTGLD